jgi:hypothetical protein
VKRLFWMGVGGVVAVAAVRRARRALQPVATVAGPVTDWIGAAREAGREFRTSMTRHEAELKAAFVEDIASPENPAPDPRRPSTPSWAGRVDDEDDDDEPYSF